EEAPSRSDVVAIADGSSREQPWSFARRSSALVACVAIAAIGAVLMQLPSWRESKEVVSAPPLKLELLRVDDAPAPFADVNEPDGIELRRENLPGEAGSRSITFAYLPLRHGEHKAEGVTRLRRWLATIALPPGERFGVEERYDEDVESGELTLTGLRTYVLA